MNSSQYMCDVSTIQFLMCKLPFNSAVGSDGTSAEHICFADYITKPCLSRQRGRVVKGAGLVTNTVSVQNPLAPFCCVLGKDTLRHIPLLGGLGKQF